MDLAVPGPDIGLYATCVDPLFLIALRPILQSVRSSELRWNDAGDDSPHSSLRACSIVITLRKLLEYEANYDVPKSNGSIGLPVSETLLRPTQHAFGLLRVQTGATNEDTRIQ